MQVMEAGERRVAPATRREASHDSDLWDENRRADNHHTLIADTSAQADGRIGSMKNEWLSH
jgi:hypothetical protein